MKNLLISLTFGAIVFVIVYLVGKVFFDLRTSLEKRMRSIEQIGVDVKTAHNEVKKKKNSKKKHIHVSDRFSGALASAGLHIDPENYLVLWGVSATVPAIAGFFLAQSLVLGIVLMIAGLIAPYVYLRVMRARRMAAFSTQLGDALRVICNCLRSGLSFRQALERISQDMPEPLRSLFQNAANKLNYGAALEDVLGEIATDMESRDLELLNAAIGLNQRVGGGLAEIVETVSETIRERIQIRQQLRTLTAMGRMSGWILGLMPVALLGYFMITNPDYMGWFFTSLTGNIVLALAGAWELLGVLVIQKIVNIKL